MLAWLRQLVCRFDAWQQRYTGLAIPVAVVRKMSEDGGGSLAAQIGYYGFLSLFPLLLVFASVLGLVLLGHPALKDQVVHTTERSLPALSGFIDKSLAGNNVALGLGLIGALWAGLGVTRATERAMNTIWDVPMADRPNLWWSRLRGIGMLCILGATFLVSTFLASVAASGGALRPLTEVLSIIGSLLLNFALYLLAFQVLTNRHLAWRTLVPGAIVGAVGWTILQSLGAYVVRHEIAHASRLYGSLGTVVALLVWIYLGAQLTLYAAEVNVVLANRLWPRSLSRTLPMTAADRRVHILQAKGARRRAAELITIEFDRLEEGRHVGDADGGSGVQLAEGTVKVTGDEAVDRLVAHLQAFSRERKELGTARRAVEQEELARQLRRTAHDVADAIETLLEHDADLESVLARLRHD